MMNTFILELPENFIIKDDINKLSELKKYFSSFDVINLGIKDKYLYGTKCRSCNKKIIIFKDTEVRSPCMYLKGIKKINKIGYTRYLEIEEK